MEAGTLVSVPCGCLLGTHRVLIRFCSFSVQLFLTPEGLLCHHVQPTGNQMLLELRPSPKPDKRGGDGEPRGQAYWCHLFPALDVGCVIVESLCDIPRT